MNMTATRLVARYQDGKRNFHSANLRCADLSSANLHGANLCGANLCGATLLSATLRSADLRSANLGSANLRGANLHGADLPAFQIPQEGELFVWKKLQGGVLAKCIVPREAGRTASLVGRKCRAEFIYVLELRDIHGPLPVGYSTYNRLTDYKPLSWVYPDKYDDDIRVECSHGIHFFLTKEEAEAY